MDVGLLPEGGLRELQGVWEGVVGSAARTDKGRESQLVPLDDLAQLFHCMDVGAGLGEKGYGAGGMHVVWGGTRYCQAGCCGMG